MKVYSGSITSPGDCWKVQIQKLDACINCQWKDTPECGGGNSLKQLKKKEDEQRNNNSN